jgi:1-acyl-sn-glycerol-3-phosphate acyltransferase
VLYTALAALLGGVVALVARLRVEVRRGNDRAARALPAGPVIVISNHTSHADGVLLALACRRMGRSLRLLATSGVFRVPLLGSLLRRLGFISVRRGTADAAAALDEAAEALAAGEAVGLYPEGRLTRDPTMWPERAKTGAVRLALRCDVPIVPVAMLGAHEVLGRRRRIVTLARNVLRRPVVRTKVGEAIDVRALMRIGADVEPTTDEIRVAADEVMRALVRLVEDLRGETSPHPHGVPTGNG